MNALQNPKHRPAVEELESEVINPSLLEPVLIAGVERRVLGLEFLLVVVLVTWKGLTPLVVLLAVLIVGPLHVSAARAAQEDPRMFDIVLRHLRWRKVYPSHGSYSAAHPPVRPSIPGAK